MTTAHAGWWRLDYAVRRPTWNSSGGRAAVATEILWSTRPLAHQARLLEPEAVGCP
jgi:hypothetical protein